MGIDMSGMVEIRPWSHHRGPQECPWEVAIPLEHLNVTRNYDALGCLFGAMNFAGFEPIAPERGLPADVSVRTRRAYDREHRRDPEHAGLWPTWIGWDEIQAVDWDERALRSDARLHEFARDPDGGEWAYRSKAAWSPRPFEVMGLPVPPPGTGPTTWPEGATWTAGDVQFRASVLTRRDAVPPGGAWQPVWDTMELLANLHDGHCRLVIWFDR